jgi:hypothetical protein
MHAMSISSLDKEEYPKGEVVRNTSFVLSKKAVRLGPVKTRAAAFH